MQIHKVIYFDSDDDDEDLMPYLKPVVKTKEEPNLTIKHEF